MKSGIRGVIAILLLLCACASAPPPKGEVVPLDGTAWVLLSLGANPGPPDHVATLRFDGGRAGGTDGCNRFSSSWSANGAALSLGKDATATLMACVPSAHAQAVAYMQALRDTETYAVAGGRLQLLGKGNRVLAVLGAQSQELGGTDWRVLAYNNGQSAVMSTLAGTEPTASFGADGRISGFAGCNQYNGNWSKQAGRLSIGPLAATRMLCTEPKRMAQEQALLQALQSAASARIEGARLELRRADGALAASLQRASAR